MYQLFTAYRRFILSMTLCMICATGVLAQEHWTPQRVAKLRAVSSAMISPDGSQIAYILSVPRDPLASGDDKYEDGPNWAELHIVGIWPPDVKNPDQISQLLRTKEQDRVELFSRNREEPPRIWDRGFIVGDVNVEAPAWVPVGVGISFLAKRGKDKTTSLYYIPIDGGEARKLLNFKTDIEAYTWSPDCKQVAFIAKEEPAKKKKELKDKGFTAEVVEEELELSHVWVAQIEGSEPPRMIKLDGQPSLMKWSPVQEQLVLALAPTPLIDDEYMKRKVHIIDAKTGSVMIKFDNPGKLGPISWAPDGKHIAMLSAADINDPSDGRLLVGDAATGQLTDVLPNYEGAVSSAAWQDANFIMFIGDEGTETIFGKVRLDGSERKTILKAGGPILSDLTLSKNGKRGAFVGSTANHPAEFFAMNHGETQPRRMTTSNAWLDEMEMGRSEVVKYAARDGVNVEGVLMHPADERPRVLYPLILCVHGGPEAHERDGWLTNYSRPGQVASSSGYFTFYPNYRGSTGRGVAFSKMGQGDEAGKEFDDLVDAVEYLAGKYPIDKTKVGVTGGSYGGFATAWCSTALTEHFAAGVMFVGISDTIGKKGTTDIPNEDYLVHTRSRPWEDKWEFYLKRSPIYHVTKARTPLLIMGGKADTRVHPSQSIELYRFLKMLGQVPVRLVQFPGEGHGNRKAALKLDYNIRMMQWFDHYLKGPGGTPPPPDVDYGMKEADKKADDKK